MKFKNEFWIIMVITFLVILTPHIVRYVSYDGLLPGEEPYYNLRMASLMQKDLEIPKLDPLINRIYSYSPYHLIIAVTGLVLSVGLASKLIPFILGMLSAVFFYLLLKNLGLDDMRKFFVSLLLVLSPVFIYTFSTSSHFAIIIFLNILGFYFFIKKNKIFKFLSLVTFASIPFFNFFNALVTLILLFAYTVSANINRRRFYLVAAGITIRTAIYHFYIFYKFGLPQIPSFIGSSILQNTISDLGALVGFGFFAVLLAVVGLVATWKKRREFYYIYPFAILLFISSFYFPNYTNIYLNFIIVVLAGYGFFFLIDRKWQVKTIKSATLLLIVCGIVFSTVSYLNRFSNMQPYPEEVKSLEWLKDNGDKEGLVLSHYSNGFWIEYFAGKQVLIDSNFDYLENLESLYHDSEEIFNSRYLIKTKDLLDKHNIRYIWINEPMKKGLVWNEQDDGLLFLFSDKETFKNIYSEDKIEIWEYIR